MAFVVVHVLAFGASRAYLVFRGFLLHGWRKKAFTKSTKVRFLTTSLLLGYSIIYLQKGNAPNLPLGAVQVADGQ